MRAEAAVEQLHMEIQDLSRVLLVVIREHRIVGCPGMLLDAWLI